MSAEIPFGEPAALVIGDTWTWKRTIGDYPAGTWTLRYYLRGVTGETSITATADGTDHLVSVAAATTAAYQPGRYYWGAVVTSGSERFSIGGGHFTVHPDPAKLGKGFDARSHARKVLEAIEAVIENRATKDQEEYTIGTRSLKRTPLEDLLKLRTDYRAEVAAELAADQLANGGRGTSRLLARL
jgi:hypothetical protein